MLKLRLARIISIGIAVTGAFVAVPVANAATARASDPLTIYDGPGYAYAPVGRLGRDEVVRLAQCTPSGRWCYVLHDGPNGWVLASYLIGSAAKVDATPHRPLVTPGWGLLRPWHRQW
jgi:uncharacterized protein YraI